MIFYTFYIYIYFVDFTGAGVIQGSLRISSYGRVMVFSGMCVFREFVYKDFIEMIISFIRVHIKEYFQSTVSK